ncbi:hypothetical protein VDG1235_4150 [Verrucomicrobiia bacterium DG1235]|nr:hypothetical protein VDG1235_4150 [Verrucomicrobiae bacterium DG1235]
MKSNTLLKLSAAALALGASSISLSAGSFQEMAEHLDLDGTLVGYMDFDGDGQEIGEKLNVIYQQFAESNPDVPPFPLDFPSMFETLGFGSIRSLGMSATEVDEGLFRNRSVTLLEGDPTGLMGMYGLDTIPFRSALLAPADATTVMSGRVDFNALASTIQILASQVMGPMGEGMVMQGLSQPIPGTELLASEVITALSGGMDAIVSQDFSNPQMPDLKVWVSLHGAGSLLPKLEPMLTQMGIQFMETESGRVADLSMLMQGAPFGLFVQAPSDSDGLILYTDAEWVSTFGNASSRLADTEKFKSVAGRLPESAAFYAYSSGFDPDQLLGMLENNPEVAPFAPLISNAVNSLFGGFLAPSASATFREGDALITEGYAGFSYKGALMALPAGIGAGVGAGIAAQKSAEAQAAAWEDEAEEVMEDNMSEPEE